MPPGSANVEPVRFSIWSRRRGFLRFGASPARDKLPLALLTVALGLLSACGSAESDSSAPAGAAGAADEAGGECNVVPKAVGGLDQTHVAVCSQITYPDNPPAGGSHYPVWAAFQSYPFPVPRGFWVHDLEHGAVVFSYNCAVSSADCAAEVARVQALIDSLPADPACSAPTPRRVVLTPDPLLDVRWGVSAWGFNLRADCVDAPRFRQFYLNHSGHGPEDFCDPGSDFGGTPPCH